jgi:orotidine-5'-phosphate decarboxylase
MNFADRLLVSVEKSGTPCMIGLDPRLHDVPIALRENSPRDTIISVNSAIIEALHNRVPAVKLQIAFYEQHGSGGIAALEESIRLAKARKLIVVIDAKRSDIASTAEAYANAFLGSGQGGFDVDAITVSPFLGRDSLMPFVRACNEHQKGIFVLVKTSNPGSSDLQDLSLDTGERVYERLAGFVSELGSSLIGRMGYSSVGAVVGATFAQEAHLLRRLMPHSLFLVPGYGAQGGSARDAANCFDANRRGAIVNATRAITAGHDPALSRSEFITAVRVRIDTMIAEMTTALAGL